MSETVSVILPVYNVAQWLPRCLDSLINQTHGDLQILCVNDGSTDDSLDVLRQYEQKDSRIRVFDKPNEGAGAARNFAYPYIEGKYVFFCDPDDWLEKDGLETLVNIAEANQSEVVFMNWYFNDRERRDFPQDQVWNDPTIEEKASFAKRGYPAPWARLTSAKILLEHDIRFSDHHRGQDLIVFWKTCYYGTRFACCSRPCYHYSLSNERNSSCKAQNGMDILSSFGEVIDFLKENHFYEPVKEYICHLKTQSVAYYFKWISPCKRSEFERRIREGFTADDWDMIENFRIGISPRLYWFYARIHGTFSWKQWLKIYYYNLLWKWFAK